MNEKSEEDLPDNTPFSEILTGIETDAVEAINAWADQIVDTTPISQLRAASIRRQLVRIRTVLERSKPSKEQLNDCQSRLDEIDSLLVSEENEAHHANRLAGAFLDGVSKIFLSEDENEDSENVHSYSDADTRDLFQMEEISRSWDEHDFIRWSRRGYDRITHRRGSIIRAFAPLRLLPGGVPQDQFAYAFQIAREINLNWPMRLTNAVLELLETPRHCDRTEIEFHIDLWSMMSRIEVHPGVSTTAIRYLIARRHRPPPGDLVRPMTNAVVEAVAATRPCTASQNVFFRWLKDRPDLWHDAYWIYYIRNWIGLQFREIEAGLPHQSVRDEWQLFVADKRPELARFLDARSHTGRAFIIKLWRLVGSGAKENTFASSAEMKRELLKVEKPYIESMNREHKDMLTSAPVEEFPRLAEALEG